MHMKTVIVTFSSRSNGNCSQIGNLIASMTKDPALFNGTTQNKKMYRTNSAYTYLQMQTQI